MRASCRRLVSKSPIRWVDRRGGMRHEGSVSGRIDDRHTLDIRDSFSRLGNTPGRIRTCDLRFRKALLYPLSYGGKSLSVLDLRHIRKPPPLEPTPATLTPEVVGSVVSASDREHSNTCIGAVALSSDHSTPGTASRKPPKASTTTFRCSPMPPECGPRRSGARGTILVAGRDDTSGKGGLSQSLEGSGRFPGPGLVSLASAFRSCAVGAITDGHDRSGDA